MFQRVITAILLLAIIVGAFQLFQAKNAQSEVKQEFDRLVAKVGRLEITDPTKFHVAPLKNDDPYHFAWRVYLPDLLQIRVRTEFFSTGHSSSTSPEQSREHIYGAGLRIEGDEVVAYLKHSGHSTSGFTNKEFAKFLREHWEDLIIESIAADGATVYDTDQVLTMLKIEIPENLLEEGQKAWNSRTKSKGALHPVFLVQMGTPEAFAAVKEKKNE